MAKKNLRSQLLQDNVASAKSFYGLSEQQASSLLDLTATLRLSVRRRELLLINQQWFVTHSGLLRLANRRRCCGIETSVEHDLTDAAVGRWVFRAVVHKSAAKSFVGYGDADPSNVSSLVRGAEMRVAETRAVNRALRKAYGIGICSVEELGSNPFPAEKRPSQNVNNNGNGAGPKVRDRLCQIIRQHQLDPELVKAYAVDYCGTKTLREATREQLENFVRELAEWAEKNRNGLLCQLNSYLNSKQETVA